MTEAAVLVASIILTGGLLSLIWKNLPSEKAIITAKIIMEMVKPWPDKKAINLAFILSPLPSSLSSLVSKSTYSSIWVLLFSAIWFRLALTNMAHKKAAGSTKNGRDSGPKYLGVKISDGGFAKVGSILMRQRGSHFLAGRNVRMGRDHTLYALRDGVVKISNKRKVHFDGSIMIKKVASVL